MSKEKKCLFTIPDWINFLNVRAVEFGEMVTSKRFKTKGDVSIVRKYEKRIGDYDSVIRIFEQHMGKITSESEEDFFIRVMS